MKEDDTNSTSPTFDVASLPSVHEHDWRSSNHDLKSAATFHLEGETVEDPYSDQYRAKEREETPPNSRPQHLRPDIQLPQPQPQTSLPPVSAQTTTMNNKQQQVTFEGATQSPQEVVHINAMFQTDRTSNNHTNSAHGPSNGTPPENNLPNYVPNKYSAHHDNNMPDWEGVTIAERTMADISTLSPPPDDYYNPYVTPSANNPYPVPVAMVAAATPGTPWEELEETDAERADWKNPNYPKENASTISGEVSALPARDRRLIWGLIILVAILVVAVSVVVPVSLKAVARNASSANKAEGGTNVDVGVDVGTQVDGEVDVDIVGSTAAPSPMPIISTQPGGETETDATKPGVKPPAKPDKDDNIPVDVDGTPEDTDDTATIDPDTDSTIDSDGNGRDTDEPTPSPIITTDEPTPAPIITTKKPNPSTPGSTKKPNPSPSNSIPETPEPSPESTPEPSPEPTPNPTPNPTTEKPITPNPTPSPTPSPESLITSNQGEDVKSWLAAHNTRREYYHETVYGETYIPLVWSDYLADEAQSWADEENDGQECNIGTQARDDVGQIGYTYWSTRNGDLDDPDDILGWWFDKEAELDWDQNSKFTQVLWRASKYLGCASSVNTFPEPTTGRTAYCKIYYCNYIRKGNCNMNRYDDWTEPMLMDDTPCGDDCPPDGCYWEAFTT